MKNRFKRNAIVLLIALISFLAVKISNAQSYEVTPKDKQKAHQLRIDAEDERLTVFYDKYVDNVRKEKRYYEKITMAFVQPGKSMTIDAPLDGALRVWTVTEKLDTASVVVLTWTNDPLPMVFHDGQEVEEGRKTLPAEFVKFRNN
jgi:hypothetical protein